MFRADQSNARLKHDVRFSEAMEANASPHGYAKAIQALITAAASILGISVLIAVMDVACSAARVPCAFGVATYAVSKI